MTAVPSSHIAGERSAPPTDPLVTPPPVDVVVPVFNGLHHVRSCLNAVTKTLRPDDHLVVVDDASEPGTATALRELVRQGGLQHRSTLLTNERNLGFLMTANRGMRAGSHTWLVVLNSDTLVTQGWLDGLHAALTCAPDVGLVSPVSNHANLSRIAVPAGTDVVDLATTVRRVSPRTYPEIGIGSGFCLAAHRHLLEMLGFFDEVFGRGYFEEADLCMRAAVAGWRTVADDATYVHHHGWASFGPAERTRLMADNSEVFADRWGDAHDRWRLHVRRTRPFGELERRVHAALVGRAQPHPRRPVPRSGARWIAEKARRVGCDAAFATVEPEVDEVVNEPDGNSIADRSADPAVIDPSTPGWVADPLSVGQPTPTYRRRSMGDWRRLGAATADRGRDSRLPTSVLVLAPALICDPVGTALLAIVDRLSRRGIRANIATSGPYDPALMTDPAVVRPFVLSGPDEALDVLPAFDVVVATDPSTVYDALLLAERHQSRVVGRFELGVSPRLLWPDDGLALAVAGSLLSTHLGPYGEGLVPDWQPVPLGVDPDLYRPTPGAAFASPVLILHDGRAGPRSSAAAQTVALRLLEHGVDVAVYGDGLRGDRAPAIPLSPATVEAGVLKGAAAVVEVGPLPGADRLRLRAAACRVPLVTVSALGPASRLLPGSHVWVAPADDLQSLVRTVERVVRGDDTTREARLDAARSVAAAVTLDDEVDALSQALTLQPEPGRSLLADPTASGPGLTAPTTS